MLNWFLARTQLARGVKSTYHNDTDYLTENKFNLFDVIVGIGVTIARTLGARRLA